MSWSDPCSNCGKHRADCDCGNWNGYNTNKNEVYEIYSFESNEWVECDKYEYDRTEDKYRRIANYPH